MELNRSSMLYRTALYGAFFKEYNVDMADNTCPFGRYFVFGAFLISLGIIILSCFLAAETVFFMGWYFASTYGIDPTTTTWYTVGQAINILILIIIGTTAAILALIHIFVEQEDFINEIPEKCKNFYTKQKESDGTIGASLNWIEAVLNDICVKINFIGETKDANLFSKNK